MSDTEHFEKNKAILDEIKARFPERVKKLGDEMGDPVLSPETYPFIFLADRDPTGTEPDIYNGYPGLILIWENTTTGDFFISPDNTATPLVWNKLADTVNLLDMINAAGWQINTNRASSTRSSPAFNTLYVPSATTDTSVEAIVTLGSVLGGSATISAKVNGAIEVTEEISGVAETDTRTLNFIVPANTTYEIVNATTGIGSTTAIVQVKELSF